MTKIEAGAKRAGRERMREALIIVTASLAAAKSLLERGGKKAVASDRMFEQMLIDYQKVIDVARAVLAEEQEGEPKEQVNRIVQRVIGEEEEE